MYRSRLFTLLRPRGIPGRIRTAPTNSSSPARRFNGTNKSSNPRTTQSRADQILARLPKSLQRYTTRLRGAPVSHVVAFLVLHEITAVVPLFALFGLFHYTDYVPLGYMMENYGGYVREGVARFERYFTRKRWFGFGAEDADGLGETKAAVGGAEGTAEGQAAVMDRWNSADGKYRFVVEVGLAYAITKVLLPVRIMASVWATPWFAGLIARVRAAIPIARKK